MIILVYCVATMNSPRPPPVLRKRFKKKNPQGVHSKGWQRKMKMFVVFTSIYNNQPHLCRSKRSKQTKCIVCKDTTPHLVCTHWVSCNDYTQNRRSTYKNYTCLACNEEYSPCRECVKNKIPNASSTMYRWVPNNDGKAEYSLKCSTCNRRFLRCDYCKVLLKLCINIRKPILSNSLLY